MNTLLEWLTHQRLALHERVAGRDLLMVHAGVLPQWTAQQTMALAGEVEAVLRSDDWVHFMPQMYGGLPNVWRDDLEGADRLRVIVNALTRLRFCDAQGAMDFSVKESADKAPAHLMPWFDVPGRLTADVRMAFGHWSTVQIADRPDVVCLDDGCVWGGCLSAAKLEASDSLLTVPAIAILVIIAGNIDRMTTFVMALVVASSFVLWLVMSLIVGASSTFVTVIVRSCESL